jgi:deoxyadenosine/deoxycytidine kinase
MHCIQEPVNEWTNMKSGTDILRLFYEEKERYSFTFENMVQLSRLKTFYESNKLLKQNDMADNLNLNTKIFLERSIFSSFNVFTLNSYEEKRLSKVEYDILQRYFLLFTRHFNKCFNSLNTNNSMSFNKENQNESQTPFKIIYIKTDPEVCFKRLKMRNRESENGIDLDYLKNLHTKYEKWIGSIVKQDVDAVKLIDGNLDKKQVIAQIDKVLLE